MTLAAGAKVGPFEIVALLDARGTATGGGIARSQSRSSRHIFVPIRIEAVPLARSRDDQFVATREGLEVTLRPDSGQTQEI
jgi:hypothetical protein